MKKEIRIFIGVFGVFMGLYCLKLFYPTYFGGLLGSFLFGVGMAFLAGKDMLFYNAQ